VAVHRPAPRPASAAIPSDRARRRWSCHRCDRSSWESATELQKAPSGRSGRCPRTAGNRFADGCRSRSCSSPLRAKDMDRPSLSGHALAEMPKIPRSTPNQVRVIEMLAYPAVQLLDVTGPLQVFASVNYHVAQAGGTPPYVLRVVAKGGQSVTASAGVGIATSP